MTHLESRINLIKELCIPSKDDGCRFTDETRKCKIIEILSTTDYKLFNENGDDGLFFYFAKSEPAENEQYVLITSHIDTVMNRFFLEETENLLTGSMDNAATNACAVSAMLENLFNGRVIIAFTGNEEAGNKGMEQIVQYFENKQITIKHYIVTDVTYDDFYDYDFSIENIRYLPAMQEKVRNIFNPDGYNYIVDFVGFYDETAVLNRLGKDNFVFIGLPVDNSDAMHSDAGCPIKKTSYNAYIDALSKLANELCVS